MANPVPVPFVELLKTIPGFFGIRLEEEPRHEVIDHVGDVEIRRYAPALLAELALPGDHDEALDAAFDRLARYIFGGNSKRADLPMTNPVYQGKGERLPMTTPVVRKPDGSGWTVAFFLTNDLSEEAPRPDDPGIRLVRAPAHLIGSLRYRGNNNEERMHDARAELLAALRDHPKYQVNSDVYWAQYDAPFVLPFVKRNEAQVELRER